MLVSNAKDKAYKMIPALAVRKYNIWNPPLISWKWYEICQNCQNPDFNTGYGVWNGTDKEPTIRLAAVVNSWEAWVG
jgi:hypothetical protein